MNILSKYFIAMLIAVATIPVFAGSRSGPHIILVNLSPNQRLEALINKRLDEEDDCLAPSASFTNLPDWISVELVKRAVYNNEKNAISELDRLMRRRYDNYIYDGFDGIMIYDEKSGPRISNLVRGWKHVIRRKFPESESAQWAEFCKLVPEIRRPI